MDKLKILAPVIFAAFFLLSSVSNAHAFTFTQKDNEAKEEINDGLSKIQPSNIQTLTAKTFDGKNIVVYNQSQAPPPTCPSDTVWNSTSQKCDPIPPPPPTCPPNQVYNTTSHQCEDQTHIPPPPPPPVTDKPNKNFNSTTLMRVGAIADIDANNGLVAQLKLMNSYHVQLLLVMGDYGYTSCQKVIDTLKQFGFTPANTVIDQGNHDCDATTKAFNGWLYGHKVFNEVEAFAVDANQKFDCASPQFASFKDELVSSELKYKIVMIHQPFVTGPSTHPANGQFSCYDPIMRAENVAIVLEGHNHNYQRWNINGLTYELVGTGTHDSGSSMYKIDQNAKWNNFQCQKCFTGTNGFALLDLAIGDPNVKGMQGWFVSNADKVMDSFS